MATLQFSEGTKTLNAVRQKKQLLPNIVDGMARVRPWALYAETPASATIYDAGYRKITYSAFANAINGVAWMIDRELGKGKQETLGYIGPNDLAYVIMILGAVKAGYKLLLTSPRNTVSDHISIFQATDCKALLTPQPGLKTVETILEAYSLRTIKTPDLYELLDQTYPHYSFLKTFDAARNEPLVVVHTSGTTAVPKPVIYTHDFAASYIQQGQLEPPPGFESQVSLVQSNRLFVTLPFFHAGNLYVSLFDAIANQTTVITPLAGVPLSAEVIVEGIKLTKADAAIIAAPFMEQIAKSADMVDVITSKMETITYGGGDVSEKTGNTIAARSKVFGFNGATETGSYPFLRSSGSFPNSEWKYMHPHPAAGMDFHPSVDGLFEAFIVKNPHYEDQQPVFKVFPHLDEYSTKDLFTPHPSKPDLWAYHGRADDIIAFKTGFLCQPMTMEQHVSQHSRVRSALMVGTNRFQPMLLIEPELSSDRSLTQSDKQELIEEIYATVEDANQSYKVDQRVSKTHILVMVPERPLQRAGKGTVQRIPTLRIYEDVINELYTREGDSVFSA